MTNRHLPIPADIPVLRGVQWIVRPRMAIDLFARSTMLAVPMIVVSVGRVCDGRFPLFDARDLHGRD